MAGKSLNNAGTWVVAIFCTALILGATIALLNWHATRIVEEENVAESEPHPIMVNTPSHDLSEKQATGMSTKWGYSGSVGPEHWGDLIESYGKCKSGRAQSPINIVDAKLNSTLLPIRYKYSVGEAKFHHTGHTLQIDVEPGSYIEVVGDRYDLKQIHFHSPSEHKFDGVTYEMEMHLVHAAPGGKLLVIAVFMEEGQHNKALDQFWQYLPLQTGGLGKPETFKPDVLIPKGGGYHQYNGSLTTPPCSENVTWVLLTKSILVSRKQVDQFLGSVRYNARPVQKRNGRAIKRSRR